MSRLEDLQPSAAVRGILPDCLVTVVNVQWYGSEALEITYKSPAGKVANELLYRHDEPRIGSRPQGFRPIPRPRLPEPESHYGGRAVSRLRTHGSGVREAGLRHREPGARNRKTTVPRSEGARVGRGNDQVTKNEILYSLNKLEDFILAIVEFDGDNHRVHYLRRPFQREPDFGVTSVNYDFPELAARGETPQ